MRPLRDDLEVEGFFQEARRASARVLMLDYDGTLAPFRERTDEAVPYPGVREALTELLTTGRTRLVIVSGRAVGSLCRVLGLVPTPELWGSHGWEHWLPDGTYQLAALDDTAREALRQAQRWAEVTGWASRCERKPAGLAFHWRGLAPTVIDALGPRVREAWQAIGRGAGLVVHPFDGGLEMRVPGRSKGDVVQMVLDQAGSGAVAAYLGDDLTDEDAFAAIDGRGLGVLVRPELRPTVAAAWLRPPEEVLAFLSQWRQASAYE